MIRKNFLSLIYDKRKIIFIFLFIFIIALDVLLVYKDSFLYESAKHPNYNYPLEMVYAETKQPFIAAFLSGSSQGHIPQEIIVWLLPIFCLFLSSDQYVLERKINYPSIIKVKASKNKIFVFECFSSYLIMFILSFIALTINLLICIFVFKNGHAPYYSIFKNTNPYLIYIVYMFSFSNIAGILSASLKSLSFIFPDYIILYSLGFGLWFLQISSPFSITYVIQPFIEYGLNYIIPAFLIFLFISIAVFFIGRYKYIHYEN